MIVCLCRGVSDRTVRQTAAAGARTLREVGAACGAGRGCGSCHLAVLRIVEEQQAAASGACGDCVAQSLPVASLEVLPAGTP